MRHASLISSVLIPLMLVLWLGGCSRATAKIQPTAQEHELLEKIVADPFVEITSLERQENGELLVITQQGDVVVRYVLAPSPNDRSALAIHHLDDSAQLQVKDDATIGTGPEPRGVSVGRR